TPASRRRPNQSQLRAGRIASCTRLFRTRRDFALVGRWTARPWWCARDVGARAGAGPQMGIGADLQAAIEALYRRRAAAVTATSSWTVLTFHEVADRARFASLIDLVHGVFEVVPLAEGRHRLAGRPRRARLLTITFDDADRSVFTHALPELQARA